MKDKELIHPREAIEILGGLPSRIEALYNSGYLDKIIESKTIDGKFAQFWFVRSQVEALKDADFSYLLGYK